MDGHELVGYDAAMVPLGPQPQTQADPETPGPVPVALEPRT